MKKYILFASALIFLSIYFMLTNDKTEMAITYFPINENEHFKEADTFLLALQEPYTINWTSQSVTDAKPYLRQDVSLLFANGYLKGILNTWAQDVNTIDQEEIVKLNSHMYIQALSYHHGEIHDGDIISSLQEMSTDELFLLNDSAIKNPSSLHETQIINKLKEQYTKQLTKEWNNLLAHFDIDEQKYNKYSLTEIVQLRDDLTNHFSLSTSNQLIGQLWEGLYKNYILQAIEQRATDAMPLILIAKDYSHLMVLYSINKESEQLIQQINLDN